MCCLGVATYNLTLATNLHGVTFRENSINIQDPESKENQFVRSVV